VGEYVRKRSRVDYLIVDVRIISGQFSDAGDPNYLFPGAFAKVGANGEKSCFNTFHEKLVRCDSILLPIQ
jgi:hypothetical protein